jgi:GMP synthase (glutamine-hydrolysing)
LVCSGGVDSRVAAALLHKAIGPQLTCIFVNNGVLRGREARVVREVFGRHFRINLQYEKLQTYFEKAEGRYGPGTKTQNHWQDLHCSIRICRQTGRQAKFLAQGTLYPDVIESVPIAGNPAAMIKSHHNVGGLPKKDALSPR